MLITHDFIEPIDIRFLPSAQNPFDVRPIRLAAHPSTRNHSWVIRRPLNLRCRTFFLVQTKAHASR